MTSFPNIETRKFPGHDYYVGYGAGVWHIKRQGMAWIVRHTTRGVTFTRFTLEQVSKALNNYTIKGVVA